MSRRSSPKARRVLPLVARFPEIGGVPRVVLGDYPSPVERVVVRGETLWIKRDDLCADPIGGNKVRALEFLLAGLSPGDRVVTVGSAGSTHALAVSRYASTLGAHTLVGRWRQEMNATATDVARLIARTAERAPTFATPVEAYAWATVHRLRGARWIAAGGTTPLGMLGHVNAGLELVAQIDAGELPRPAAVVVPLGTGGTAAGLSLAFTIAGANIRVIGARVTPRIVARRGRVLRLARRTASLIERLARTTVPRVAASSVDVVGDAYGGAYGRETSEGRAAAQLLHGVSGIALDATYSAKAFALALDVAARESVLFWLTFDSRILGRGLK